MFYFFFLILSFVYNFFYLVRTTGCTHSPGGADDIILKIWIEISDIPESGIFHQKPKLQSYILPIFFYHSLILTIAYFGYSIYILSIILFHYLALSRLRSL